MNPHYFCAWLQGFFDLTGSATLTEDQVITIKCALALANGISVQMIPEKKPPQAPNVVPFEPPPKR